MAQSNHGMEGTVKLKVQVWIVQEGKYYVAYCPYLELSSYGRTQDEAKDAFDEALDIFLEDIVHNRNLHEVLTSLGWKYHGNNEPDYSQPEVPTHLLPKDYAATYHRNVPVQV